MLETSDCTNDSQWKECRECGDHIHIERWALGYRLCLFCGEDAAAVERASWCVVMEYGKGNYQYVTPESAFKVLKDTNQKNPRA
jgi:hypothetical protein